MISSIEETLTYSMSITVLPPLHGDNKKCPNIAKCPWLGVESEHSLLKNQEWPKGIVPSWRSPNTVEHLLQPFPAGRAAVGKSQLAGGSLAPQYMLIMPLWGLRIGLLRQTNTGFVWGLIQSMIRNRLLSSRLMFIWPGTKLHTQIPVHFPGRGLSSSGIGNYSLFLHFSFLFLRYF